MKPEFREKRMNTLLQMMSFFILLVMVTQSGWAQPGTWMMEGSSRPTRTTEPAPTQKPETKKEPKPETPEQVEADPEKTMTETETGTQESEAAVTEADETLELARKAQNPVSNLISFPIQYNANLGVGPSDKTTQLVNLQPVVPLQLSDKWSLINRAIVPISYVPNSVFPPGFASGAELGFGDTTYQGFFAPSRKPGQLIWGAGPVVTFPTATADKLGTGKWLAGVSAAGLTMKGKWVMGALATQQWSVAGNSARPDVSLGTVQPFVVKNMNDGWYVLSAPTVSANWEAPSDERWTVPIGAGFGRIFAIGDQKVNLSLAGYRNVVKPTNAADWQIQFQWTLLFPGSK
jgi:hypothetical protein